MFQNLRLLKNLILYITFGFSSTPYIIYTSNNFSEAANLMADIHTQIIPNMYGIEPLDVIIKYKENYNTQEIQDYLEQFQDCSVLNEASCNNTSLCEWINYSDSQNSNNIDFCFNPKYLMIIGDENIIPSVNTNCGEWPFFSDDLFNLNFSVGRIISSNNTDAVNQINKIINYLEDDNVNNWKSKLLLVADNEFTNNPNSFETTHTQYTSDIYNIMKNQSIVNTLYATEYEVYPSSTQPEVTEKLINSINSGIGIMNYIGHGTNQSLAHELILKNDRDINLFSTINRPPIWIVGTCGFGEFVNNNCMAEELLKKDDAAIAVLSTTVGISVQDNSEYLLNFYNGLSDFINNNNNFRLGDLFKYSKKSLELNNNNCIARRFQLFGDPALPIMFTKKTNNNIFNIPDEILIGSSNSLTINPPYMDESYIKILDEDIINQLENISYNKEGATLFESSFINNINFYLPIDVTSNNIKLIVSNDDLIQIEPNVNSSLDIDQSILNDNSGPEIKLYNNNFEIYNNAFIHPPYNFTIELSDSLPINLSGYNNHDLKFWIDNNQNDFIILNDIYNPISSNSGSITLTFDNEKFNYKSSYMINIEAWDILNNQSIKNYVVNVGKDINDIFNVFNFPNPFHELTYFTFHMKNPEPIYIDIEIFSKNGKLINKLTDFVSSYKPYHVFPEYGWDGTDKYGKKIINGTYFYNLKIKSQNGKLLHNNIHNITILR